MSLPTTLILMAAGIAAFVFCAWRSGRPADPARGPRMIPWTLLMLASAVFVLTLGAHLLGFFGIETGRMRF